MNNILDFDSYLNESGNSPSAFQKLVTNLDNYGTRLKYSGSGNDSLEDDVLSTLGNLISTVARTGRSIGDDFGIDWVDDKKDLNYYARNRKNLLNRWEREKLDPGKRYSEYEIEKIRKEFDEKAKKRFGRSYNFLDPGKEATAEELVWSDYAANILKKYTNHRR